MSNDPAAIAAWLPAAQAPSGTPGCWTTEVATVSNLGSLLLLAYYHGADGEGRWQRPGSYKDGEQVEWWQPMPWT